MKPISLILFDLGNVITTNDWHVKDQVLEKALSVTFNVSIDDLEKGFQAAWSEFEMGKIDEDAFWKRLLNIAGVIKPDVARAKELWRNYQKADSKMLKLLKSLRPKYKVGILSNIPKEWLMYKNRTFKLNDLVDGITDSSSARVAKPNPKIYRICLNQFGVTASEVVFIDDKERNLKPARQIGMRAIKFVDYQQCLKALEDLSVEFK